MRQIRAGRRRFVSTSGVEVNVDQALTQTEVDLLVGVIQRAGLTPDDVVSVALVHEGETWIEVLRPPGESEWRLAT